jgi:hypothetical protein
MTFWANHLIFFVDQGSELYGFQGQTDVGNPATRTLSQQEIYETRMAESTYPIAPTQYASWNIPGVTNKKIYDWSKYNVNSLNENWKDARVYNVEVQQLDIIPGLNAELGWFRQEIHQINDDPLSQTTPITLTVDTDKCFPMGLRTNLWGRPS